MTPPRRLSAVILAMTALATGQGALAQRALYGNQPEKDAIFVRFVNALDSEAAITSNLAAAQTLGVTDRDRIGRFEQMRGKGSRTLTVDVRANGREHHGTLTIDPGTKVSVVIRAADGGVQFASLNTRYEPNQTKTVLAFYNAAPPCGASSLLLRPAGTPVFPDVPPDAERSRLVNPVNVELGATCSGQDAIAGPARLDTGTAYSVLLLRMEKGPVLLLGADDLPKWQP